MRALLRQMANPRKYRSLFGLLLGAVGYYFVLRCVRFVDSQLHSPTRPAAKAISSRDVCTHAHIATIRNIHRRPRDIDTARPSPATDPRRYRSPPQFGRSHRHRNPLSLCMSAQDNGVGMASPDSSIALFNSTKSGQATDTEDTTLEQRGNFGVGLTASLLFAGALKLVTTTRGTAEMLRRHYEYGDGGIQCKGRSSIPASPSESGTVRSSNHANLRTVVEPPIASQPM